MSDSLFPSGPWTGFYSYFPGDRHRMDMVLTFASGRLTGDGNDDIGPFVFQGHYDEGTCECHWTKTYLGRHDVYYRGFREGKGIWGTWELGSVGRGGFHIWPRDNPGAEAERRSESGAVDTERAGVADAVGVELP